MKISLGFSPCPNDTFIFDALVNGKIDAQGLEFEIVMADVEDLNRRAFSCELDVTKLSYHAFAWVVRDYSLLRAGSALGKNCGPLLISKKQLKEDDIERATIAIPGKYTTANFLLSLAYPNAVIKNEMLFSEIEDAVLDGKADAGLIIHENRFTYQDKGLIKILDLGEFWEKSTGLPIPLGGIAVKKSLPVEIQQIINQLIMQSVRYALENPRSSENFVKAHAQEMSVPVMYSHIKLYVNEFTVNLGTTGETAIHKLFEIAREKNVIPSYNENILID